MKFPVASVRGGCVLLCSLFLSAGAALAAPTDAPSPGFQTSGIVQEGADTKPQGVQPAASAVPTARPDAPFLAPAALADTKLLFSPTLPSEIEPNDTTAAATPLVGTAVSIQGNIYPAGDVDLYSFVAAAGDRVYAATMTSQSSNASVDSVLTLLASDGTTVIETDADDGSFGATSSSIAGATLPSAGTYYLRVSHAAAATQLRGYRLYFQLRSGAPVAEVEPNDTFPGQALPSSGWVSASTSATTDVDFYSLPLNAGDTVFVSLDLDPERDTVEWNAQVGLGAFGTPPLILIVNDAGAATPDSEAYFMTVKEAGTYGVFVALPTGGTTFGTYHLNVTVFPAVDAPYENCTTYTSTNVPVTIPDGPGIVTSTLTVPGNPRIGDMDVSVNLTHNFMADLDVQLTAPGGNTVGLFSDIGSVTVGAQTTMDVTFDDEAAVPPLFTVTQGLRFTPEFQYRLGWFDGQPAGGTWTMTLRDDATGDGGVLNSWSLRICEPPPPPACPVGFVETTVYSTDFEGGIAGFTHSGAADEWELGLPTAAPVTGCNSGTSCFKTDLDGTYEASSNQALLSPPINLAGLQPPVRVRWAQKYQLEPAQFDSFWAAIEPAGNEAAGVRLFQHLGADMVDNVGNPIVAVQEAAGWGSLDVGADAFANQSVQLRFALTSDTTVQRGGVAIDDVSVTACRALSADLSITKTDGVTSATPGGAVNYTITAGNAGPDPVGGATVVDTFPPSLTCTWTCFAAGGGSCTSAGSGDINDSVNLPVGGSVTYSAACAISAAASGTLSNTATVSSSITDPVPGSDNATDGDTVLVRSADLSITKDNGAATAIPGSSLTYTIVAANAGPSDVAAATVTDTFPPGCSPVSWTCSGTGAATCGGSGSGNIADAIVLPAGTSVTYSASCTIDTAATGTLSNTATITTAVSDPNPGNESDTDETELVPTANLSITKTDNTDTYVPGGSLTYVITASNAGPSPAFGATVTDTLPTGLTCTWTCAGSLGGSCTGSGSGNISDSVNLPSGSSATYTAICAVAADVTGDLTNTATVTVPAGVDDPTEGNNIATDTDSDDPQADLSITKTDGLLDAAPGDTLTYTIVAGNAGPSGATGATVTDTVPADLTCTWTCAGAGGGICSTSGSGSINDSVTLPVGGNVTYTASCDIAADATGTISNTATIAVPAGVTEVDGSDNSDTDTTALTESADVSITKTDGVDNIAPGASLTYTIVASNAGPQTAEDVVVTDTFPATCGGVTYTATGTGGATGFASGSGNIADSGITLPAGATVTYTATCTVDDGAADGTVITNTATVGTSTADGNTGNDTDSDSTTVQGAPAVSGTKTVAGDFEAGGTVTYTIVLDNAGNAAQPDNAGDEFTDPLPAGLTYVSATATSGTASFATGTVRWNGTIAAGASVTITIVATINDDATGTISNQGTVNYDADANGSNETSAQTDDPAEAGATNPTAFEVDEGTVVPPAPAQPEVIPATGVFGLFALALLMLGLGWHRRRMG